MARKKKLNSKVNYDGVFWQPKAPNDTFPGKLARVGSFIHLTTSAEFRELAGPDIAEFVSSFGSPVTSKTIEVLHGVADGDSCTLLLLHELNDGGFNDLSRMQSVRYKQYRVSLCILGLHASSHDSDEITSARISYSALKYWQRAKFDLIRSDDATSISFPRNEPPLIEASSASLNVTYSFDIKPELRLQGGEFRSRNEAILEVRPNLPKSVDWFFERAYRAQGYFSLILGSSLQTESIALKMDDKVGWCRRRERGKTEEVRYEITVKPSQNDFGKSLLAWLDLPESFVALEHLLFAIREEKVSVETNFLSVAKALEGFQRLTSAPRIAQDGTHRKSTTGELISRISPAFAQRLLGDPELFEEKLRDTRNHLTHPGIPLKRNVVLDSHDLFLFTVVSYVLLRLLLLRHIGLSEALLQEPIYRHSRLWT